MNTADPQEWFFSDMRGPRADYHPVEFLGDEIHGYVTCDGYQAYHNLPECITVTGCMVHARQHFDEALTPLKKDFAKEQLKETTAYQALERMEVLYNLDSHNIKKCQDSSILALFY